jgi:membrane protein
MRIDRDRLLRLGTFWLRPDFVLRVVARFQRIAGFDRSIALASSALTAMVPLTMLVGALVPHDVDSASRIIRHYDLSGPGAQAVRDAFGPAADVEASIGIVGFLLLIVTVLSFTRAVQRLFEQTWELPPLSVRNSFNGAKWLAAVVLYFAISGSVTGSIDRGVEQLVAWAIIAPLLAGFLILSGRLLSAQRIAWRDLVPFGIVGGGLLALYQFGATIYAPYAFNNYAARYGVIGVVLAMVSSLFGAMVVLVGSAALGREVRLELDRIRDGIRPSDDDVSKQWDIVIAGVRERQAGAKAWIARHRPKRSP